MNDRGYELHLGDCLEVMKGIPDGSVDAVLTDPPYGIGINKSNRLSISRGFGGDNWDNARAVYGVGLAYDLYKDKPFILWGGNYYADMLPPTRGWLIWDKLNDKRDFGEAELAWTNIDTVIRRYKKLPVKMDGGKVHPTQKPIELMRWCLNFIPDAVTIIDPYMGSGSTGVACMMEGRRFIGCEIDPTYFKIAEKRIHTASLQPRLIP